MEYPLIRIAFGHPLKSGLLSTDSENGLDGGWDNGLWIEEWYPFIR
jgi:hypothetical protein